MPYNDDHGGDPAAEGSRARPGRRRFLQMSAATAGATLHSACLGGADGEGAPLPGDAEVAPRSRFDQLAVAVNQVQKRAATTWPAFPHPLA